MRLPADPDRTARFRDLVRSRIGLALPPRGPDLARAVRQATEETAVPDADTLYRLLAARALPGEPLDALVGALNISETHFFRDASQMATLERVVLPELIARRRPERRLRVWSAGCSTGEEPYTLAMLIHRLLPDRPAWDVLVLGTDINGRSLATARRGRYRAWSLRGMPESAQAAYLRPAADGQVQMTPEIHRMVTFEQLNLAGGGYPTSTGAMDLILCRNVLLYFEEAAARTVVRRLRDALRDDGWLLLSQVEASLGHQDGLVSTRAGATFRCRPRAGAWGDPPARAGTTPASDAGAVRPIAGRPESAVRPEPGRAEPNRAEPDRAEPGRAGPDRAEPAVDEATTCGLAIELWQDGQHEAALARLERAASRDPLLPQVHYLHALIMLDRGRDAEALAGFRRCTYADPGFAPAHLAQAGVLARLGQHHRAGIALAQAAQLAAGREPDEPIVAGADLRVAEVRELIASQRRVLATALAGGPTPGDRR